jgi:hypothetical protein
MELSLTRNGEGSQFLGVLVQLHLQKPEVRSRVMKIIELALSISPMHLVISFIEYLSIWEFWLNFRKS